MFLGCQFSLYPMTDGFVGVILDAIKPLNDYRSKLRVETDDISTTLIGPPEALFPALKACFLAAAHTSSHLVMNVSLSRGCPGEPDDPLCHSPALTEASARSNGNPVDAALERRRSLPPTGVRTAAQIALYPLGQAGYMDEIAGCIAFAKEAGVFDRGKHFCSRLQGDAADVFEAIEQSFLGFAGPDSHVVLTAILSKGSPTEAA
jgi:energy-coupling factor transport system substrate-specific component